MATIASSESVTVGVDVDIDVDHVSGTEDELEDGEETKN